MAHQMSAAACFTQVSKQGSKSVHEAHEMHAEAGQQPIFSLRGFV